MLTLDTARLTPGPHRVDAVLVDVAGNETIVGQYEVTVAPRVTAAPPVSVNPGKVGRHLVVIGRATLRAPYAEPRSSRGRCMT